MKKFLFILSALVVLASCGSAGHARKSAVSGTNEFRYDIDYVRAPGDGINIVKIWSYGRSASAAENKCYANAVHGALFKGFTGNGGNHPAIVRDANGYADHREYFDKLFSSGAYMQYCSEVNGTTEVRKISSGEYKVGKEVKVNVRSLRKTLEQNGIIRGLASGF